jgi:hypothetical protein
LKHDFNGIASYDSEKAFITSTRSSIYEIIESELTVLLNKIPKKQGNQISGTNQNMFNL